jgi:hypothetical protein
VIYSLVYVSSATSLFSRSELVDILEQSRRNNAAMDVSGMLLYKEGNLMQVLEGERAAVESLYAKIGRDPRHKGLLMLLDEVRKERQFADWSMAFTDLEGAEAKATPGYSQFLGTPLTGAEFGSDPSLCQRLLTTFKQNM